MRRIALLIAATAAAVQAAPATGATWRVWAGAPTKPPGDIAESMPALNQFLPNKLQIHVGDKVTFLSQEFHTATFLGATPTSQMPLVMPDPAGSLYAGFNDLIGLPFWFNGLPKFIYNTQVIQAFGSANVADREVHNSGILLFHGKAGYTFKFPKAGTYKVVCIVHPFMEATIVVKRKRAKIPSRAKVAARVLKQLNQSWSSARSLASQTPSDANTVFAGVGKTTTLLAFLPARLTVPVGTTVTWQERSPTEIHNIAFGDIDYIQSLLERTDLLPVAPGAPNQVTPFVVYGSEPAAPYVYNAANHGNGFLATPVIDQDANSPSPEAFQVKFTKQGTYHYICMVHGKDMAGDIVVTG